MCEGENKLKITLEVGSKNTKRSDRKMNNANLKQEEIEREKELEKLGYILNEKGVPTFNPNLMSETLVEENELRIFGNGYAKYKENYWEVMENRELGVLIRERIRRVDKLIYMPVHHKQTVDVLKYDIEEIKTMNVHPHKMNFLNCVFNFKSCEVEEHDMSNNFNYVKPYELSLGKEIPTPCFDKFLREIFENNEGMINYILYLTGYLISGTKSRQNFYICKGKGKNGKSVYLQLLEKLVGEGFVISPSLSKLSNNKFALGNAEGKKLIIASENQNKSTSIDTELLKSLTGNDRVEMERKFKDAQTKRLNLELIFSANSILKFKDDTYGFKRRIQVIPFNYTVENPDFDLPNKLEQEIPGIMNKVIKAFINGTKNGITACDEIVQETERYIKKAIQIDIGVNVGEFLDDYIISKAYSKVAKSDLYAYFLRKADNASLISRESFWKGFHKWAKINGIDAQEFRNGDRYIRNIELVMDPKDIQSWEREIEKEMDIFANEEDEKELQESI